MNFGIIVFPDVEELDFVGPWEMLTMWSKLAAGPQNCLIVAEKREPVVCAKGLSVNPHVSFADLRRARKMDPEPGAGEAPGDAAPDLRPVAGRPDGDR